MPGWAQRREGGTEVEGSGHAEAGGPPRPSKTGLLMWRDVTALALYKDPTGCRVEKELEGCRAIRRLLQSSRRDGGGAGLDLGGGEKWVDSR